MRVKIPGPWRLSALVSGSWYHLGIVLKISDEPLTTRPFYMVAPPGVGISTYKPAGIGQNDTKRVWLLNEIYI